MTAKDRALDAWLVARARSGDQRAMAQLVALRGPRLLVHATRLLGEREAARDVVQEAWVEILRGLKGLRDGGVFLPWSLRFVSRRVAREIRRRQRGRRLAEAVRAEADPVTPEAGPGEVDERGHACADGDGAQTQPDASHAGQPGDPRTQASRTDAGGPREIAVSRLVTGDKSSVASRGGSALGWRQASGSDRREL